MDLARIALTVTLLICAVQKAHAQRTYSVDGVNTMHVTATINGRPQPFELDTGSSFSALGDTEVTKELPIVGTFNIIPAGGAAAGVDCPVRQVKQFGFGGREMHDFNVLACPGGFFLIGLDILRNQIFELGLNRGVPWLTFFDAPPAELPNTLTIDDHIIRMDANIAGAPVGAMFDTDWTIPAVSREFFESHREHFRNLNATIASQDVVGNMTPAPLYEIDDIKVGDTDFGSARVMIFDLSRLEHKIDFIIGAQLIQCADWTIDLKNNRWLAMIYHQGAGFGLIKPCH